MPAYNKREQFKIKTKLQNVVVCLHMAGYSLLIFAYFREEEKQLSSGGRKITLNRKLSAIFTQCSGALVSTAMIREDFCRGFSGRTISNITR